MNMNDIEFCIDKLTELLIKQEFIDRKKGKITYIKKSQCYRDLIELLKKIND